MSKFKLRSKILILRKKNSHKKLSLDSDKIFRFFKTNKIDFKTNLSYLHLSVDYQHNFDLIERIINELLIDKIDASLDDILEVL